MNDTIGTRVQQLRTSRGMSRKELADQAGLSAAAIGHIETEQRSPNATTIAALATALEVSADYLLGLRSEEQEIPESQEGQVLFRRFAKLSDADRKTLDRFLQVLSGDEETHRDAPDE